MKRLLSCGFLLMGLSFTATQSLLIRELLVAFSGNELAIGLVLGNWLILEAVGSGCLGRLAERWQGKAVAFATLEVLFAVLLPVSLYAVYVTRSILGAIPGEGLGLIPILCSSFVILIPIALVDGAMFAFGCRAYAHFTGQPATAIGWTYVLEAAGAIAGGILFTYVFIPFLQSLQVVLILSGLNLLSAVLVLAWPSLSAARQLAPNPGLLGTLALLVASAGLLFSPWAHEIQRWATRRQWAGYNLVYSENSVYGNVAVVQQETQYTFYADGIPILTAPEPDVALSEEMVHLPMLFVHQPRRALVLAGGLGGVLGELGKYPLTQIVYAELDPMLVQAVNQFPTPLTLGELSDPRVKVELVDGRRLASREQWSIADSAQGGYDLVIVNLPYPSTLQLNRFYTVEFFQIVRRLVADEGVLVITCPGTLTAMSQEMRSLNAMVYHTLQQAFPYIKPIPGDTILWLASPSDKLLTTPVEALVERWQERGIEARLVTAFHIRLKLDQRHSDWFWASLDAASGGRPIINRDLHPVGVFYGLAYWNAIFAPDWDVFALVSRLNTGTGPVIIGCAMLLLALIALGRIIKASGIVIPLVVTSTGLAGMAADLILVLAFQALYGYVYHWVGLLITAFMVGLSLGGLLMTRRLVALVHSKSTLLKLELLLVLYLALLPFVLSAMSWHMTHSRMSGLVQGIPFILNALAGLLVGAQFPLANRIWLKRRGDQPGTAGVLYACDLVGACAGSIAASVILVPVLGVPGTCLMAALLKSCSLVLASTLPSA